MAIGLKQTNCDIYDLEVNKGTKKGGSLKN